MAWTVTQLLTDLKVRLQMPESNGAVTDAEFLKIADQVLWLEMEPLLQSLRSDYYVKTADTTIVANTAQYRIPHRAVGSKVRDVLILHTASGREFSIPEIAPEDAWRFSGDTGSVAGYYFRGEHVVLLPTPNETGYQLRLRYYLRRPRLDNGTYSSAITALPSATTVTVAAATANMITGESVDIIRGRPYFDHLEIDNVITNVAANTLTITAYSTDVAIGDYVAESGYSPVVPLPAELYPLLMTGTAIRVMQSRGDPSWQADIATYERDKQAVLRLFEPRNDGQSQRIVNFNSPLRAGRFR